MVIDSVMAETVEVGDFVVIEGDHVEVRTVTDEDVITIGGYSHDTGDDVSYDVDPFDYLDIWSGIDE
jgi:hypothetical protein